MTPNFTLREFEASDMARERGIDNSMPPHLVPAARQTMEMLERIRAELSRLNGHDVPVLISSGFRCPALNWAVRRPADGPGSDATGDHPLAAAVDWRAPSFGSPLDVCRVLAPLVGALGIGQLIYERTWVHTSTRPPAKPVNRIITLAAGGGYLPGIVGA